MKEKIAALAATITDQTLPQKDWKFAKDLIAAYAKYGGLTEKQAPWIDKLILRASGVAVALPVSVEIGDFAGITKIFKVAAGYQKFPKITLICLGKKISLIRSKNESISVCGEGQYPNRPFYGKISPVGSWQPTASTSPEMLEALTSLLKKFAENPSRVASKHGKETGVCCFCAAVLTYKRSVAAGFGPVCADHYGLKEQWNTAVKGAVDVEVLHQKNNLNLLLDSISDEILVSEKLEVTVEETPLTTPPTVKEQLYFVWL